MRTLLLLVALGAAASAAEQGKKDFDPAAAFGSRPSVSSVSISPDGASIAFIAPSGSRGASLFTMQLGTDPKPRAALGSDGKPFRLRGCEWVSNARLVCTIYGLEKVPALEFELAPITRLIAVDADGRNLKLLSTRQGDYTRGLQLGGGEILDLLPDEDGVVLMTRVYLPDDHIGSHIGSAQHGTGVDRIDTRTLQSTSVEPPRGGAVRYITDGRGNVRIMGLATVRNSTGQLSGVINFLYRSGSSREWHALGDYDEINRAGFLPVAVDPVLNAAFGYKRKDGRLALYKVSLDGTLREEVVYEHPDVDVGGLVHIGRRHRVVGVTYATDRSMSSISTRRSKPSTLRSEGRSPSNRC